MKLRKRILIPLIILVLAYGSLRVMQARWDSYACVHQTIRIYPYAGSTYYAELYDDLCSGFGESSLTSLRLVKPGLFGTKLGSKKDLFVYDPSDILEEPTIHWIKPDMLEFRTNFVQPHSIDPPVEEMDGIKIVYVFGKDSIDNPQRIKSHLKTH